MSELSAELSELKTYGEKIITVTDTLTELFADLRRGGEIIVSIAESLTALFSSGTPEQVEALPPKPAKKTAKAEPPAETPAKSYTKEDVRALLSASASHRWLNFPPSAKLCAQAENKSNPYAQQGTDAHTLCEHKVLRALGRDSPDPTENLDYYDQEMENCAEEYCSYVMEQLQEAKKYCNDPEVLVEQHLDFSKWM